MIVERGGCSFSTKVKIAAEKGAHAVIIVDKQESKFTRRQMKNVIVAEDSYEDDIHIPSIFVCRDDGMQLVNAYKRQANAAQPSPLVVELAWNIPRARVVTVDQWMSSASGESLKFLKQFAPRRKVLNQVIKFQPHFTVFSMGQGGSPQTINRMCSDSSGRYCAEDPDGDGPVSGKDVLEEDLRQLCLHTKTRVAGRTNDIIMAGDAKPEYAEQYWAYIEKFAERCSIDEVANPATQFGPDCSYALMAEVGVSESQIAEIRECSNLARNTLELEKQKNHTAWSPRALRINGWRYSGILDAELVCSAICAGFSKEPEECVQVKARDRVASRPFQPLTFRKAGGVGFFTMLGWILATGAVIGAAFFLYRQYLKREMRFTIREEVMLEVETQMGEYGRLRD
jgi:hypothetical protein